MSRIARGEAGNKSGMPLRDSTREAWDGSPRSGRGPPPWARNNAGCLLLSGSLIGLRESAITAVSSAPAPAPAPGATPPTIITRSISVLS
eukprot:jgi/Botrbrau1/9589/Bobra.106_2s0012.1